MKKSTKIIVIISSIVITAFFTTLIIIGLQSKNPILKITINESDYAILNLQDTTQYIGSITVKYENDVGISEDDISIINENESIASASFIDYKSNDKQAVFYFLIRAKNTGSSEIYFKSSYSDVISKPMHIRIKETSDDLYNYDSYKQTTTNNIEIEIPGDIALITYAENILNDEFGDADFIWSEYYNVVPPNNNNLRCKVEGYAKINNNKHSFIVIYKFDDNSYKYYRSQFLQIDKIVIYDLKS